MKTVSTTNARKHIAKLIDSVRETGASYAIGRHNKPEALLIKFPVEYNAAFSDITNVNAYSESFSFLENEPELYSVADLKRKYV